MVRPSEHQLDEPLENSLQMTVHLYRLIEQS
jgi:hypothetical protein